VCVSCECPRALFELSPLPEDLSGSELVESSSGHNFIINFITPTRKARACTEEQHHITLVIKAAGQEVIESCGEYIVYSFI
jgi:hypothetical protein